MDFSARVKELCKAEGIMMKDLAKRLSITPIGLSKSLRQRYPQLQTLERIANALNVDLAELFIPPTQTPTITCPHCGKPIKLKTEV